MRAIKKIIKKAQTLSADELLVRGSQTLQTLRERKGLSGSSRMPSDEALFSLFDPAVTMQVSGIPRLRLLEEGKFLSGFIDRERTVDALQKYWGTFCQDVIGRANEIVEGRFRFFGFDNLSFGDPIDWHLNPISGQSSPLVHWSSLNNLDNRETGDRKIIWELNRHQYFSILGQAYWLTGDERYAETFVSHLTSWMDQNPPKIGINWSSSLEIAFRSISWLWAFHFFRDSTALSSEVVKRALKFLYLNARHLESFLSTYFSPNTHLTGEGLGLFYLGHMLPEFREAARWKSAGATILNSEVAKHVQPDGVYFEQTSYYHRYTTDFYLHYFILLQKSGAHISEAIEKNLKALLDHLMYLTRPDGTTPFVGDDDGGRLISLNLKPANDFRACLSTGAVLFERSDYKFVSRNADVETLWLLGPAGVDTFASLKSQEPPKLSVAFEDGGYFVMRDSWSETANYMLVDCGPHGTLNCGHAHADALSIDVAINGRPSLVDPGTYSYTGEFGVRDWFRRTAAHNTLTIRGESSSKPGGPFSWETIARCTRKNWMSHSAFDYFKGEHDGYTRLSNPSQHQRSIFFVKQNYWVIRDELTAQRDEQVELWFHFTPGAKPCITTGHDGHTGVSEAQLNLMSFGDNDRWRTEDGWVSDCYLKREQAEVCVLSAILGDNRNVITFLLPVSGNWQVRRLKSSGGEVFEIVNDTWHDIVMIRAGKRVETEDLSSDFQWTWARRSDDSSAFENLVAIGGKSFRFRDRVVVNAARETEYLVAMSSGGQVEVDPEMHDVAVDVAL